MAKLSISAIILLASSYFAVNDAYPFLKELARSSAPSIPIAKNYANVARHDAVIDNPLGMVGPSRNRNEITPLPPQPEPLKRKPTPTYAVRLEPLRGIVLGDLHVSGVVGGSTPKITINGMLVGIGGVVDNKRRLRFVSLDESRRMIVFGNGAETISKPY